MALPASSFELSDDNYYSPEANWLYMSVSQLKDFQTCEKMAMAKLQGLWEDEPSDSMLVGSYVHAGIEGTLETFIAEHKDEIFNKKGEKYAAFKQADIMIETLLGDEFIKERLEGLHEFIVTAEFAGCMWKAKIDVYQPNERIVDVKTAKAIYEKAWDKTEGRYVSWVEAYRYHTQLALYVELERRWFERDGWLEPLIVAVTKEDPPDKAVIGIDEDTIAEELQKVEHMMQRILEVKNGIEEPTACGVCKYCRATKQVTSVIHFRELAI